MIGLCRSVLVDDPAFVIITAYAIRASFVAVQELTREVFGTEGKLQSGELVVQEEDGSRLLSTSLFARWTPR